MQFRKSISQTAECLMKYMKSRRARDLQKSQRFAADQRLATDREFVTD